MNDEKPVALVEDEPTAVVVPPGKVLIDNKLVDRADVCFGLRKLEGTNIEKAMDGTTYQRQADGSIRRVTIKKHHRRKRRNRK